MTELYVLPTATKNPGHGTPIDPAFLAPSPWCDADHPAVRYLAHEITRGLRTPREKAVALFYWVRDEVRYTLGNWNWTASETLALRLGTCSNKANLLVAMARAVGIPAGFHVMDIRTRNYFAGALIPMIRRVVRETSVHLYATVFLDGRWVKCDATDDRPLSESIVGVIPHAATVEFNGRDDATHGFAPDAIIADHGPLPSVDRLLSRRAGFSEACRRVFGHYVCFMRDHGARYALTDPDGKATIERDFRAWLGANHPADLAALAAEEQREAQGARLSVQS